MRSRITLASMRHAQRGATLIVTLVMLGLLMLLGITAMTASNTQFRLAGNIQFATTAFNHAESALVAGEQWIAAGTNYQDSSFTTYAAAKPNLYPSGYLAALSAPANSPLTMTWSDSNSLETSGGRRYYIEKMAAGKKLLGSSASTGSRANTACNQVDLFRITARGEGARGAVKFTQSIYSVLSCS